jgi:hypothetical protein
MEYPAFVPYSAEKGGLYPVGTGTRKRNIAIRGHKSEKRRDEEENHATSDVEAPNRVE